MRYLRTPAAGARQVGRSASQLSRPRLEVISPPPDTAHDMRAAACMAGTLIGFGYADLHDSADLRQLLGDAVDLVVDVRIKRWSGIRPFSTAVADTVATAGYDYLWIPGLGNAGHRRSGPMRLVDPDAVGPVVSALRDGQNVALMCACTDAKRCHRRFVIELAREAIPGLDVHER